MRVGLIAPKSHLEDDLVSFTLRDTQQSRSVTADSTLRGFKFHTVSKLDTYRLVIYGGCDEVYEPTNRVWLLTFDTSYTQYTMQAVSCSLEPSGSVPIPRRWGHCAEIHLDSQGVSWLFVAGGKGDLEESCPTFRIKINSQDSDALAHSGCTLAYSKLVDNRSSERLKVSLSRNTRSESTKSVKTEGKSVEQVLELIEDESLDFQAASTLSSLKNPRKMSQGGIQSTKHKHQSRPRLTRQRLTGSRRKVSECFGNRLVSSTTPQTNRLSSHWTAEPVGFLQADSFAGLRRSASCLVNGLWFVFGGFDGKQYSDVLRYSLVTNVDDALGLQGNNSSNSAFPERIENTYEQLTHKNQAVGRGDQALRALKSFVNQGSFTKLSNPLDLQRICSSMTAPLEEYSLSGLEDVTIVLENTEHLNLSKSPGVVLISQKELAVLSKTISQLLLAHKDTTASFQIRLPQEFILLYLLNKSTDEVVQTVLEDDDLVSDSVLEKLRELSDYLLCYSFIETLKSSSCRRRLKQQAYPRVPDSSLGIFFEDYKATRSS